VDEQARTDRIETFERRCHEEGRRVTVQRRVILEAVLELDNHPTADQVFEAVSGGIPGVARTTVYRTLDELYRLGVISKACHPGQAVRYDARTEPHHHLVCTRCNEFIDFTDERLDAVKAPDTSALDFEVSSLRVQLLGICGTCRATQRKEEST
jgi:Fur family peroxide stress response transcriptional regulator